MHPAEGRDDTGQLLAAGGVQQEARDADFESGQRREAEGIQSDLEGDRRGMEAISIPSTACMTSGEKGGSKRGIWGWICENHDVCVCAVSGLHGNCVAREGGVTVSDLPVLGLAVDQPCRCHHLGVPSGRRLIQGNIERLC